MSWKGGREQKKTFLWLKNDVVTATSKQLQRQLTEVNATVGYPPDNRSLSLKVFFGGSMAL